MSKKFYRIIPENNCEHTWAVQVKQDGTWIYLSDRHSKASAKRHIKHLSKEPLFYSYKGKRL